MSGTLPDEKPHEKPGFQRETRSSAMLGRTLPGSAPPPGGVGPGAGVRITSSLTLAEPVLELGPNDALPRTFGRLTLLRRLARGGMGEVYLAATRGIEGAERPCVVKTIRQEHQTDKSFRARFLDETRIQAQLQHPGVAQILEAATLDDGRPYAVVEYIEGRHLGEVQIRSNQLGVRVDWPDVAAIGLCFADALAHLHERTDAQGRALDIAHRDLSPQNVMLGYAGDLKLIDFGTARGENRRCRTVSGIVFAKPGYVAPEVANQIPGGAPADLYAFGVMLWELLAGRRFLQGDPIEHQALVAKGEMRLPALAASTNVPARFDEILARVTHPDLVERTPSARRVVAELAELLKQAPSLADGDRSVRGRIALFMQKLYPAEPTRSRADFARRVAQAREQLDGDRSTSNRPGIPEPSPAPAEVQEEMDGLLEGTRYRLARNISRGAMGEVWEAEHVDLGRTVALKLLPEGIARSGSARARFRAEARAVVRLEHPGLVKLHDFGITADGRSFYAMELLDGDTLEKRLERGPLPWQEAVAIARRALEALGAAHAAGIVHRDITPSNLFLTSVGGVKLLDFGVAASLSESAREQQGDGPVVVGTPEYISPEQAAGVAPDARSDLYAIGVVLYEALTGRLPHPLGELGSPTLAALLTAKITVTPPSPSQVVASLDRAPSDVAFPKGLDAVVLCALERDAEKRFRSAEEFLEVLDRATTGSGVRARFPKPSRATTWGALASLCAVAGALWMGRGAPETSDPRAVNLDPEGEETVAVAPLEDSDEMAERTEASAAPAEAHASKAHARVGEDDVAGANGEPDDDVAPENAERRGVAPDTVAAEHEPFAEVLAEIDRLEKRGQKITAHHHAKELAAKFPTEVPVLARLTRTAKSVKAWGEALDAATRRVAIEPTPEAIVELARLERATLKGDPRVRLEALVKEHPDYQPARALLSEYGQKLAKQ